MPKAKVGDVELHYETAGTGRRLLFIGGSGGDLRQRPNVLEGPLVRDFEVLAFDQRGLGRSDKPDGAYTMAEYAGDAAGLLAHLGWSSAGVMGVSFGGMVGQELALRHPERVERLVLACTSSGGEGGASYPLHELAKLPPEERAARGVELADRRNDAGWRKQNPDAFARLVELAKARQSGGDSDEAAMGARRQLEARRHHDTWERLPSLRAPTLLCAGRYDGIAPPENMEALARRIPDARLEFFEGGHLFLLQDRSAFPKIAAFLAGE